jgi:transposase InsO family protein
VRRARTIGIQTVLIPVHAPQANALAERVIGTIRRECLDHLIVLNEAHLRRVLLEYVAYYNDAGPDRSLALEPPAGPRALAPPARRASVVGAPVLWGLHHVYDWAA